MFSLHSNTCRIETLTSKIFVGGDALEKSSGMIFKGNVVRPIEKIMLLMLCRKNVDQKESH